MHEFLLDVGKLWIFLGVDFDPFLQGFMNDGDFGSVNAGLVLYARTEVLLGVVFGRHVF